MLLDPRLRGIDIKAYDGVVQPLLLVKGNVATARCRNCDESGESCQRLDRYFDLLLRASITAIAAAHALQSLPVSDYDKVNVFHTETRP